MTLADDVAGGVGQRAFGLNVNGSLLLLRLLYNTAKFGAHHHSTTLTLFAVQFVLCKANGK